MTLIPIGKVTHYYDKVGVAVIDVVNQPLKKGDVIRVVGRDNEFTQEISSLQVEHTSVEEVLPGDSCGIEVAAPVSAGDMVYLVG